MNIFDKILGRLHLDFLNRRNSPSQKNIVKANSSSISTLQQAGGDIVNVKTEMPAIEVLSRSAVSDLVNRDNLNIYTFRKSTEPLIILECSFDGVPTNHASKKLDDKDLFHFETIRKENIKDKYEPVFILKVRKQTGEEFLFKSRLRIELFGDRYDLTVPGDETIEPL